MTKRLLFGSIPILSHEVSARHELLLSGEQEDQVVQFEPLCETTVAEVVIQHRGKHRVTFRFWLTRESATLLRDDLNVILRNEAWL